MLASLSVVLRCPRLAAMPSPASRPMSPRFDGRPPPTHRSAWRRGTPPRSQVRAARSATAGAVSHPGRQSSAPSIERQGTAQIPLVFTGAVAKDVHTPVVGGGRAAPPGNPRQPPLRFHISAIWRTSLTVTETPAALQGAKGDRLSDESGNAGLPRPAGSEKGLFENRRPSSVQRERKDDGRGRGAAMKEAEAMPRASWRDLRNLEHLSCPGPPRSLSPR